MANKYTDSDGNKYTTAQIDSRVRKAKEIFLEKFRLEHGYHFCETCKKSRGVRLSCSHIVSVDQAKKSGKCEVAWDTDDLELLCVETCHTLVEELPESDKWEKYLEVKNSR